MTTRRIAAITAATLALGITAGCTASTKVNTSPDSSHPAGTTHAATAAAKKIAHVGDTVTISQSGESISVTLVKVDQTVTAKVPAADTPDAGDRFAGVQLRIHNTTGKALQGFIDNDVTVQDAQGQSYQTAVLGGGITAGPSFPVPVTIAAGASALGWVVLNVAKAATITQVQFTTNSGLGNAAQWAVP